MSYFSSLTRPYYVISLHAEGIFHIQQSISSAVLRLLEKGIHIDIIHQYNSHHCCYSRKPLCFLYFFALSFFSKFARRVIQICILIALANYRLKYCITSPIKTQTWLGLPIFTSLFHSKLSAPFPLLLSVFFQDTNGYACSVSYHQQICH